MNRPLSELLAPRMAGVQSSAIRDLLDQARAPGMLSMAGGLPNPKGFPHDEMRAATLAVLENTSTALQYDTTEGMLELRELMANAVGGSATADQILVVHGSQQGLDLICKVLLAPGDVIAVDDPSYLGAVQVFSLFEATFAPIPSDEHGMRVDVLAEQCAGGLRPKLVYVVANFHNPSGATLSEERRRALVDLSERYGFVIIEDDPYGALRFDGVEPPSLWSLGARVIRAGSFSKMLFPGFRLGFLAIPPELYRSFVMAKQATDLHSSTFGQHVICGILRDPEFLAPHVAKLRTLYGEQARTLAAALRDRLGERIWFATPEGGMFLWCRVAGVNTDDLARRALANKVAIVPGRPFCLEIDGTEWIRLSYATLSPDELVDGVDRLARSF